MLTSTNVPKDIVRSKQYEEVKRYFNTPFQLLKLYDKLS
jgi:hypothetical protein